MKHVFKIYRDDEEVLRALEAREKLQKELNEHDKTLQKFFEDSPEFRVAKSAVQSGRYNAVPTIHISRAQNTAIAEVHFDWPDRENPTGRRSPRIMLESTVTNTLLNGKILSDEQKQKLVKIITNGLLEEPHGKADEQSAAEGSGE
jgi:hypothetical protein